ncbi:outer membrane protein assembly factor BamC [Massilia sp. R2A-15]|uniref:outer membrane protein assembly factor BamC n=1 Tax=Massilia sp. R2A-15 TaxID=3064278 RepID=UPI0027345692|nr:outer membrane protein assembly factor BamC [Massilia sp. R2A-15]WLI87858.1 outer membrane protein assembly factor BamC [Massilia sp. R2A-15]
MTIRKTFTPAATRGAVLSALMVSLAGCSYVGNVMESDKLDYRGAKKAAPLDVPPDLTQLQKDNRYAIPDGRGVATASGLQQKGAAPAVVASGEAIGVAGNAAVKVERNGNQRWLVVKQSPEQLWPQLKDFWHDSGFTVESESATTGVMETNWAEDRSKIPQDFIRNTLGKVFDSAYGTGRRDKFRTRLERAADGSTEIYISHRGAEEVLTGPQKEIPQWTSRPNDPGLEAAFLAKLMARLTGTPDVKAVTATVENAPVQPLHAKLAGSAIEVDEGFDRAWRRVGLALDRVGFTVEDRDRVNGVYFVRYVDPDLAGTTGFFKKLFTFGAAADKEKEAQRYRVSVKSAAGATTSQVTVQTNDGKPETTATGAKILKLLGDELK